MIGEITNEDTLESYSGTKKYVSDGAVLGYGTSSGGYMKTKDTYTEEEEYLEDRSVYPYTNAVSKIDENNLKQIASDIGIDYINMNNQKQIYDKLDSIKQKWINNEYTTDESNTYIDIYYILVIPISILLAYEFITYKRRLLI